MKTRLIIAAVVFASTAAQAGPQVVGTDLYECTPVGESAGARTADPVYKTNIAVAINKDSQPIGMSVEHILVSGAVRVRNDQYTSRLETDGYGFFRWSGSLNGNQRITMRGSLDRDPRDPRSGRWMYSEAQWDKGRFSWSTNSACHPVHAPEPAASMSNADPEGGPAFKCNLVNASPGALTSDPVRTTVVGFAFRRDTDTPAQMFVEHTTWSGKQTSRTEQYSTRFQARPSNYEWVGTLSWNARITMHGVLAQDETGRWTYIETQYDQGKFAWSTGSVCSEIPRLETARQPEPPASRPPPAPAYTPPAPSQPEPSAPRQAESHPIAPPTSQQGPIAQAEKSTAPLIVEQNMPDYLPTTWRPRTFTEQQALEQVGGETAPEKLLAVLYAGKSACTEMNDEQFEVAKAGVNASLVAHNKKLGEISFQARFMAASVMTHPEEIVSLCRTLDLPIKR